MRDNKSKIKSFIVENFLFGEGDGLKEETSFLEEGIIDSTGIAHFISNSGKKKRNETLLLMKKGMDWKI